LAKFCDAVPLGLGQRSLPGVAWGHGHKALDKRLLAGCNDAGSLVLSSAAGVHSLDARLFR
jgi:hypothetical protein